MNMTDEILNSWTDADNYLSDRIETDEKETLKIKGDFYPASSDKDMNGMLAAVETSYAAASNYSLFNGTTTNGLECGWYGFKHTDAKVSTAILLSRGNMFHVIRVSGEWKYRLISQK